MILALLLAGRFLPALDPHLGHTRDQDGTIAKKHETTKYTLETIEKRRP